MNRNSCIRALVLISRQTAENLRNVTLFSPERGIFQAVLYGGPKSKLRSLVSPYHSGKIWLYTNEINHSTKITDFDVSEYRPHIRENLYKTWAASLCAEILIKTAGGNSTDNDALWQTVCGFLDGISIAEENACRAGTIRFLWRFILLSGIQPDIHVCARCGAPLDYSGNTVYSPSENGFLCAACAAEHSAVYSLSNEALFYLRAVSSQPPSAVRKIPLPPQALNELMRLLIFLIQKDIGKPLKTMQSGLNIFMQSAP
ncbi:MAG: DNA repair protein RecO [Bacteroides sp.]|nr:DNA repair protein RecO [Prevotella sp.]MCM1407775.1 DNA repair protein RecO [Treponema brennaborense]MCM1468877.1 DNA repair protein RecO [Bacteroides sp.]